MSPFATLSLAWFIIKVAVIILWLLWRWRFYYISFKIPGPWSLPIFGNFPNLLFKHNKSFFERCTEIVWKNEKIFTFWMGIKLFIVVRKPEEVDKILYSQEFCKNAVEKFPTGYHLGAGKRDKKWRTHKKVIKPIISVKLSVENLDIFQKHIDICKNYLNDFIDKAVFDVGDFITHCFMDSYGEIILGENIESQLGKNKEFVDAFESIFKNTYKKNLYLCLHHKPLYTFTTYRWKRKKAKETVNYFIEDAMRKSWQRRKLDTYAENSTRGSSRQVHVIDELSYYIETHNEVMTNIDFRNYLRMFFLKSVKSVTTLISFALMSFALKEKEQERIVSEICSHWDGKEQLKYEQIQKMKYLDLCIQELLRLFPPRPFILRQFSKDIQIENWTIPQNCEIAIPVFNIHRDPDIYEKPNDFYPDRFLSEVARSGKCKDYSFGLGPKECLGKLFSIIPIKLFLVNILRTYKLEAEGDLSDLKLTADPFLRLTDGCKIKLIKR